MYSPSLRRRSQRLAQKRIDSNAADLPLRVIVESPSNAPERAPRFSSGFPGTRQELLKYVEENAQILSSATGCDALRRAMMDWFPMLGNDDGLDYTCPICSGRLEDPAGCGHCSFRSCHSCLVHWCKKQMEERGQSNCPQCRANIVPLDSIALDLDLHRRLIAEPTFSQLVNQVKDLRRDNERLWELVKKQGEEISSLKQPFNRSSAVTDNHGFNTSLYLPATLPRPDAAAGQQQQQQVPLGPYSNMVASNLTATAANALGPSFPRLRFSIGDRVLCRIGPEVAFPVGRWVPGRIVQQWYRESPNSCVPYLVRLDDGRYTTTPFDNNFVILRDVQSRGSA